MKTKCAQSELGVERRRDDLGRVLAVAVLDDVLHDELQNEQEEDQTHWEQRLTDVRLDLPLLSRSED